MAVVLLFSIAHEARVVLISDEPYRSFVYASLSAMIIDFDDDDVVLIGFEHARRNAVGTIDKP